MDNPTTFDQVSAHPDKKQREMDFLAVEINLREGRIAVSALHATTYQGLAASTGGIVRRGKELVAEDKPLKQDVELYKNQELLYDLMADAAKVAVDAAEIIFAHAILDATLHKLCKISATIDPNSWMPMIQEKRIPLKEVKAANVSQIERKLLGSYLEQLERESLMSKCDALFKVVRPKHTRGVLKKFKYSHARMVSLDQLRHDLVHKLKFHRKIKQAEAKVCYLFNAGQFFFNLLSKHYNIGPL